MAAAPKRKSKRPAAPKPRGKARAKKAAITPTRRPKAPRKVTPAVRRAVREAATRHAARMVAERQPQPTTHGGASQPDYGDPFAGLIEKDIRERMPEVLEELTETGVLDAYRDARRDEPEDDGA